MLTFTALNLYKHSYIKKTKCMKKQVIIGLVFLAGIILATSSCKKEEEPVVPTVTTADVTPGYNDALGGGNVTDDGKAEVTARGVVYSSNPGPTISNNKTSDGTGTGAFISDITGLAPGFTYYVRAYATNSAGTGYGSEKVFTTLVK
jgi:hypothetical protein